MLRCEMSLIRRLRRSYLKRNVWHRCQEKQLRCWGDFSGDVWASCVETSSAVTADQVWIGFTRLGSSGNSWLRESSFSVRFTFTALQLHMMSMTNMLSWFHASVLCCHVLIISHHASTSASSDQFSIIWGCESSIGEQFNMLICYYYYEEYEL